MMRSSTEILPAIVRHEGVADERIARAFEEVAREDFVPPESRSFAYEDRPIAIPERQTTSQPTLIARMIDAAAVGPEDRVLEVGTGYGYQTALLARLAREVVSIERYPVLAEEARANLEGAGIEGVEVVVGDGWQGWPARAPYDAMIVSAGASEVPPALAEQLQEGGRLIIPLSGAYGEDVWKLVIEGGQLLKKSLITPARFVPLIHGTAG